MKKGKKKKKKGKKKKHSAMSNEVRKLKALRDLEVRNIYGPDMSFREFNKEKQKIKKQFNTQVKRNLNVEMYDL